jgi:hypothetical protein
MNLAGQGEILDLESGVIWLAEVLNGFWACAPKELIDGPFRGFPPNSVRSGDYPARAHADWYRRASL